MAINFIGGLLGKAGGETAGQMVGAVGNALDKLFTSDGERLTHGEIMEKLRQQPGVLQVELNKIEAASASVFVAGWRPAIGWVCALSLFAYYVPRFSLAAVLWVRQSWEIGTLVPYPDGAIESLMELVVAMLGIGALRTIEKFGGVASK